MERFRSAGRTVESPEMGGALMREVAVHAPPVGREAPPFDLPAAREEGRIVLDAYRGIKPVVLVFGSYT